ncbi:9911_t:CDS:1, partial [Diversispora eburnea]
PLTFEKADWLTIPTNTCLVITPKLNVLLFPIKDQYYNVERSKRQIHIITTSPTNGHINDHTSINDHINCY